MKASIILLAAASCANATWLRWSVNREHVWAAQETGYISESETIGWTPIPTPAPGLRSEGEIVLDLLRRQKTSETEWTNSATCGWFSGVSSSPVGCGNNFTCATNSDNVVACASGTFSPFYTACLDYSAFKAGSCTSLDAATGCCQREAEPACGTYLWTGSPERSMYKCFETASILTILDVPQFVVDASLFSKTHTTPTPTLTKSGTATDDSSSPDNTGGSNPGSGEGNSGSDGKPGSDGAAGGSSGGSDSGSGDDTDTNNTPIIVGSVVGGIAGLLLLLLLLLCLSRKNKGKLGLSYTRNKHNNQKAHSTNVYHTAKLAAPAAKGRTSSGSEGMSVVAIPSQQAQHHYYHPQAQAQPQQYQQQAPPRQYQTAGQQPISVAYTVNQGATHTSHPSYSSTASYATVPSNTAPSAAPNYVVGGIVPVTQQYQQPQAQPQQQQQQQQQQPGGVPQMQPVNHIHVYYATPPQNTAQGASYPSAQQTPATNTHSRDSGGSVPDALGLYTQYQDHGPGYRQSF